MAARNIFEIYTLIMDIARKQRGVFISIPNFNTYAVAGQLESYQEYRKLYGATDDLHDAIQPFKVLRNPFTSSSSGLVTYPSNYSNQLAGYFSIYGSTVCPITFLNPDQIPDAITNQLRAVTLSDPIAEDYAFRNSDGTITKGFQLYPMQTQIGFYSYLRLPEQPVLAVTQVNRVITYDPLNSVQFEFSDTYMNNVVSKILKYVGINMAEPEIQAFAQSQQEETK